WTLWLLWKPAQNLPQDEQGTPSAGSSASFPLGSVLPPWPLALLFVFWVTVDRWFWLGLATVARIGLGQILDLITQADGQGTGGSGPNFPPRLRPVFLSLRLLASLCLLAALCLLNPSNLNAFTVVPGTEWLGLPEASGTAPGLGSWNSP